MLQDALQPTGYKKPQLQKALDSLTESGAVTCIVNGKQSIYLVRQAEEQATVPPEARAAAARRLMQNAPRAARRAARRASCLELTTGAGARGLW